MVTYFSHFLKKESLLYTSPCKDEAKEVMPIFDFFQKFNFLLILALPFVMLFESMKCAMIYSFNTFVSNIINLSFVSLEYITLTSEKLLSPHLYHVEIYCTKDI